VSVTQLNLVSTSAADGGGTEGLIQTPILQPAEAGYNYGFTDGFMEYGAGTPGSLPFKVDEHGNVTSVAHTASGIISQNAGTDSAGSAPVINSLGATNGGGGVQLSDLTRDYMVYLAVNTAGTATTVSIGHTSAASDVAIISSTGVGLGLIAFRLPAGWYFKWSGTTTTISVQNAVGC
jgi:hypothetical protein